MADKSDIYSITSRKYLDAIMGMSWDRIRKVHCLETSDISITIPFFNRIVQISDKGFIDDTGKDVSFDVAVVLSKYLLMCPNTLYPDTTWVSFKDFRDSGPLTVFFEDHVEGKIKQAFSDFPETLKESCLALGGFTPQHQLSYDLVMAFNALPHIPVFLLFNQADEDFSSSCSLLFEARAERFLDPESLAIMAAVLAGKLCSHPGRTSLT